MIIIPTHIAREMESLEADIADIEADASKRVAAMRQRLDIYKYVVKAFGAGPRKTPDNDERIFQVPAFKRIDRRFKDASRPFSYDEVIAVIRAAPADEGVPYSQLPVDHHSRMSVLKAQKVARKLPSGNWTLVNP